MIKTVLRFVNTMRCALKCVGDTFFAKIKRN